MCDWEGCAWGMRGLCLSLWATRRAKKWELLSPLSGARPGCFLVSLDNDGWFQGWNSGVKRSALESQEWGCSPLSATKTGQSSLFLVSVSSLVQLWLGFLMLNFSHVDLFNVSQRTNSRKLPGIRIFKWNKSISVNNFSRHYERTLPPSDRWEKCIWSFYFSCRYFSLGHHQFRPDLFLQPTNRFSLSLVLHLGMPSLLLPELFFLTLSFVCSEDHSVPHHSQDKE